MKENSPEYTDHIEEMIRSLCFIRPDPRFWDGLDEAALISQFEETGVTAFGCITPIWNLSPPALSFNDVAPEALSGAELYMADREAFLSCCADAGIYCHSAFRIYSDYSQILKVAGQWLRGDALTPPLFFLDSEQKLRKVDGHHRITVALLAETPILPFYCQETLTIQGIDRASPELLSRSTWSANEARM